MVSRKSSTCSPRVAGAGAPIRSGGDHRRARVVGHRVPVDGDAGLVQAILSLAAVELIGHRIDENEVHIGAAREHANPRVADSRQLLGDHLRPSADVICDLLKADEVQHARVCRPARDDQSRLARLSERLHRVHVDQARGRVDPIRLHLSYRRPDRLALIPCVR